MVSFIIIGDGHHAKVLEEELKLNNQKIFGFLIKLKKNVVYLKKKIEDKKAQNFDKKIFLKHKFLIGIGENSRREKIFNEIMKITKKINWGTLISKNAFVFPKVKVGKGSVILSDAVVNTKTKIGIHCVINNSSSINHHNVIKDFCSIAPGSVTGGNVKIGKKSFIGIGSVIKNNVVIFDYVFIGGGSFVNKNCPSDYLYYGNPVKKIRKIKKNEKLL